MVISLRFAILPLSPLSLGGRAKMAKLPPFPEGFEAKIQFKASAEGQSPEKNKRLLVRCLHVWRCLSRQSMTLTASLSPASRLKRVQSADLHLEASTRLRFEFPFLFAWLQRLRGTSARQLRWTSCAGQPFLVISLVLLQSMLGELCSRRIHNKVMCQSMQHLLCTYISSGNRLTEIIHRCFFTAILSQAIPRDQLFCALIPLLAFAGIFCNTGKSFDVCCFRCLQTMLQMPVFLFRRLQFCREDARDAHDARWWGGGILFQPPWSSSQIAETVTY